ncbi:MAG: hypothetical protein RDU20_14860 [Desulfomonilaceae bacterium]|nr:hypothetical protein [Desulfomonilaceae bacterium]
MTEFNPESPEPIIPRKPVKRNRRRAILLGLVILLGGFLLGAGSSAIHFKRTVHMIQTPGEVPKKITNRLRWKLKLTDLQAEKVQAILIEREKALSVILSEVHPRLREELDRTRVEVEAVLDADQAKKWHTHFDAMQRRWFPGMRGEARKGTYRH